MVLTASDGTRLAAYLARPGQDATTGVVILPDVRGLHPFYKDLAVRFAEAGHHAVAIDYFGRTAGVGGRDRDFPFKEHMDRLDYPTVDLDTGAAVAWLRENTGARFLFTVGFCFGGAMSWRQSAAGHGLDGCVGLYGIPSRAVDRVPQMAAPLLLLAAGRDFTPVADVEAFAADVRDRGVGATLKVYPDAPHSFFDRSFAEYRDECADVWQVLLDFVAAHSDRP